MAFGDDGSNYNFGSDKPVAKPQSSSFDLGYTNSLTACEGRLYPTWYEYTVLGDTFKIGNEALVRVINNPVVPLASRQRVFFHTYYGTLNQLWKYANVFFPKGYTAKDVESLKTMTVPKLAIPEDWFYYGSTLEMLGFSGVGSGSSYVPTKPVVPSWSTITSYTSLDSTINKSTTTSTTGAPWVPLFKLMLYLRIWRDYHCNKRIFAKWLEDKSSNTNIPSIERNYYKKVKEWMFPLDDADFRIGTAQFDSLFNSSSFDELHYNSIHFLYDFFLDPLPRMWSDDYFTTCLPTPLLEQTPSTSIESPVTFASNVVGGGTANNPSNLYFVTGTASTLTNKFAISLQNNSYQSTYAEEMAGALNNTFGSTYALTNITMDALRNLACANAILEKLAKTDGSYAEFGRAYFGVTPNGAQSFKPRYVGGCYQPILYTDVVNTANDQGMISGKGISASNGEIGSVFCDDYGICMTLMSIMGDTYYSQGWKKQDLYTTADDFYLPERAKLGLEPVMDAEIYYSDANTRSVFGYQNRYDSYRYRANEVHGVVANFSDTNDISCYIQQRHFTSKPTLSKEFLDATVGLDNRYLSVADGSMPTFFVQLNNNVFATRPIPYKAIENNLGF